jgi:DNA-directed RNA polymerase specialized sigma24 family protein
MSPLHSMDRPSRRDLDQLTEQVRPDLEDLFQRLGVSQADAEKLLRETLVRLAYQWGRIRNRSWWLLDTIEKAARALPNLSPEELDHDE